MVTLESVEPQAMNLPMTQATANSAVPAGPARFAFTSGARPLDGYTIKRGIGQGGFGEVYYAVSDAGKEVALKLIRRNLDIELRGVTQCLNLKHPNLVALFDVRQDGHEETWVVMEYVSGQSLQEVLVANPNGLPVDQVMHWMQGIAAGVAYLHDHGIVHRDLKPGNVFCEDGIVKIGDYGLSKFISCSQRSGHTGSVGTVHYMAPEVANGRYGKEVDIYALGIVLFEMITGHVPFDGESLGEILMKHLTAQPDVSMIAEPYRTAIVRALAKDPEQRIRSVGELMALLPRNTGGYADPLRVGVLPPAMLGANGAHPAPPTPAVAAALPVAAGSPAAGGNRGPDFFLGSPPVAGGANPKPSLFAAAARNAGREEPLWRLMRTAWLDVRHWWDRTDLLPWQRLLLVLAALVVLLKTSLIWLPVVLIGAPFYAVYWVIWAVFIKNRSAPMLQQPAPVAAAAGPAVANPNAGPRRPLNQTYHRWRNGGPPSPLLQLTPRQRATELAGSMFAGAIVAILVALVMFLVRGGTGAGTTPEQNQYAWLTLSAIIGTWGVLIPAKLWQGAREDATLRRFAMLAVGLLVGAAAYGIQTGLLVNLPYEMNHHLPPPFNGNAWRRDFYDVYGKPSYAYLTYFGFLFFIMKWWRQANPLRHSRLSLWSVAVTVFCAGVANMLWPLPQPWGLMLAATISISVQMASTWIPIRDRGRGPGMVANNV
jgi:hypothetical protein